MCHDLAIIASSGDAGKLRKTIVCAVKFAPGA